MISAMTQMAIIAYCQCNNIPVPMAPANRATFLDMLKTSKTIVHWRTTGMIRCNIIAAQAAALPSRQRVMDAVMATCPF